MPCGRKTPKKEKALLPRSQDDWIGRLLFSSFIFIRRPIITGNDSGSRFWKTIRSPYEPDHSKRKRKQTSGGDQDVILDPHNISFSWRFSHVLTLDCKALKANPLTVNSQDLWLAKDNRFLNPKISYERILMAPPCRLISFPFLLNKSRHAWRRCQQSFL